jgi:hypothetical protein
MLPPTVSVPKAKELRPDEQEKTAPIGKLEWLFGL